MFYARADKYKGEWKKGKRDGIGKMKYGADGAIYKGLWKDDLEAPDETFLTTIAAQQQQQMQQHQHTMANGTTNNDVGDNTTTTNGTTTNNNNNTKSAVVTNGASANGINGTITNAGVKYRIVGGIGIASKRQPVVADYEEMRKQVKIYFIFYMSLFYISLFCFLI